MKVLVACEESQAVCIAFRKLGHEAYSCDTQECSGGHPEWHIKGDVLPLINGNKPFITMDGDLHAMLDMGFADCFSSMHLPDQCRFCPIANKRGNQ